MPDRHKPKPISSIEKNARPQQGSDTRAFAPEPSQARESPMQPIPQYNIETSSTDKSRYPYPRVQLAIKVVDLVLMIPFFALMIRINENPFPDEEFGPPSDRELHATGYLIAIALLFLFFYLFTSYTNIKNVLKNRRGAPFERNEDGFFKNFSTHLKVIGGIHTISALLLFGAVLDVGLLLAGQPPNMQWGTRASRAAGYTGLVIALILLFGEITLAFFAFYQLKHMRYRERSGY